MKTALLIIIQAILVLGCTSSLEDQGKVRGGLLSTEYETLDDFADHVKIKYSLNPVSTVLLTHQTRTHTVYSKLTDGVSQKDFVKARDGSFIDRVLIGLNSPFAVRHRKDMQQVHGLARVDINIYGEGDIAFYYLAEQMVHNIISSDLEAISSKNLTEKGYINTFNHITGQAFVTSIFSEDLADFIADIHERYNMPELTSGKFTEKQLANGEAGPVDNYVDMVNNEWGHELGKILKHKYSITPKTHWTPVLLTAYLNDIQSYYGKVFLIDFIAFKETDEMIVRFSSKMNRVLWD